MVAPAVGSVVTVRFPFSDLTSSKVRPAVVLADAANGDWVLCQVTSNAYADADAVLIEQADFASGSLNRPSYARPGKLFTADEWLMRSQVGKLSDDAFRRVMGAVVQLLQRGLPS